VRASSKLQVFLTTLRAPFWQELRGQLLAALQKARDAERRALALEAARDSTLAERQVAPPASTGDLVRMQ
jgi:hypothetical protein